MASKAYTADVDIGEVADYNEDGFVNIGDVICLVKAVVNNATINNGDLNGDRKVSLIDAIRLIKYIIQ